VQFPVHIELHRSHLLSLFLIFFHVIAAGCVMALPWHWVLQSLLGVLLGVSFWYSLQPTKISALRLSERAGLDCILPAGDRIAVQILPDSTVFRQLLVLRLRFGDTGRVKNLVLLPDNMLPEQFRVLRLWLRWQTSEGDAKSA
jgi:hypothetical protein